MPASYKIIFSDGSPEVEWFGSRGFYYEFSDGASIVLRPTIAWCSKCSDFVDAEWIQPLKYIEHELVKLNDPASSRALWFTSPEPPFDTPPYIERRMRLFAEAKEEAARRIVWRRARTSPPRCLMCGSTDLQFPKHNQTLEIPGRGAALVEWTGFCSTEFCNWFYTPEGVRIERETKPSYWHLPGDKR